MASTACNNNNEAWHSNFYWKEIFNDNSGKTSAASFIGVITSVVCLLLFITLIIFYFTHLTEASIVLSLIDKVTTFFGIGAGLMGVKSISSIFDKNQAINISNQIQSQKQSSKKEEKQLPLNS